MPQNGTTGLWPAVRRGRRTLQPIYRTEYKRNRALSTLLWVENLRYLCPNSDLRPTRKAWGVDKIASCSTEMDAVQIEVNCAVICPEPRRDRAKSSKKMRNGSKKIYITRRTVSVNCRHLYGKFGIAYGRGFCIDIAGRGCIK